MKNQPINCQPNQHQNVILIFFFKFEFKLLINVSFFVKTAAVKVAKKDSSSSESSDDSDDEPATKKPVVKAPLTNGKVTANGKISSSSDDSSDSDAATAAKKPKLSNQTANKSAAAKKKDSSSSDSSDSDSDANPKQTMAKTPAKLTTPQKTSTPNNFKPVAFVSAGFAKPTIKTTKSSSDDDSTDDSDNNDTSAKATPGQNKSTITAGKKRKLSENGDTPLAKKANNTKNSFNKSSQSQPNTPFRRVKTEEIEVDTRLNNNSFDAKVKRE